MKTKDPSDALQCDVLLIGAGIMSATLATFLKELDPTLHIEIFERLDHVAGESTDAKNNAGTGHSALCELNYTPEIDGKIEINKARNVMECFEVSKQFWAYLRKTGAFPETSVFIHSVPHMSFVEGEQNVAYLKKRHAALQHEPLFAGMLYSEDRTNCKRGCL